MRPVDPAQLQAAGRRSLPLHRLEWIGPAQRSRPSDWRRRPAGDGMPSSPCSSCRVADRSADDARGGGRRREPLGARSSGSRPRLAGCAEPLSSRASCVLTAGRRRRRRGRGPRPRRGAALGPGPLGPVRAPGRFALSTATAARPREAALRRRLATAPRSPSSPCARASSLAPRLARAELRRGPRQRRSTPSARS